MAKTKRPKRKGEPNTTIICEWCGEHRECARRDTKTCGQRCRRRLSCYLKSLGYPPDGIQGKVTAQEAINREIRRLVMDEKHRRVVEVQMRKAYIARKENYPQV